MGGTALVEQLPGYEPDIGRWLWALEEARRRTLAKARDFDQRTVDWEGPDGGENAIGSLLYHLALVEMSWLHFDLLELPDLPPAMQADFPHGMGAAGRLTRVPGVPLARHLELLARSRDILLTAFRGMPIAEWERLRGPPDGDRVTPAWVVFHLVEHEAGHAAQIGALARRAARFFGG